MNAYTKYFDKNNKYINLLVSDKKILEKYSEIWNKIKSYHCIYSIFILVLMYLSLYTSSLSNSFLIKLMHHAFDILNRLII